MWATWNVWRGRTVSKQQTNLRPILEDRDTRATVPVICGKDWPYIYTPSVSPGCVRGHSVRNARQRSNICGPYRNILAEPLALIPFTSEARGGIMAAFKMATRAGRVAEVGVCLGTPRAPQRGFGPARLTVSYLGN